MQRRSRRFKKRKLSREDSDYLLNTELFAAAPEESKQQLLACLAPVTVRAGDRFIHQGDEADCLYLIQRGSCSVNVEKDGVTTPVTRRDAGELIGEMSILTGEHRTAHVDAETDMSLWRMSRVEFDQLCLVYPGIREFVTELITKRISQSKFTPHRTVGKYLITDMIDEGGWGIVYRGVHRSLNMPVAIKMLKHVMAMDADFSKKFQNEAMIVARLKHPNIVRVYDIERLYRTIFIVMEYLSGCSLKDILQNMPSLSVPRMLNLLIQVAQGLEYAHKQGIVHQDIKPGNIFVEEGDRAKIVDFGLACPVGAGEDLDLAGTPSYMSPEQIAGDPVDERTDIYSLGITAFEMSTGQKPFPGPDVNDILKAHREEPVPNPCLLNPDLPATFNAFVTIATQKDPSMRYQTVGQVLEHLKPMGEKYRVNQTAAANPEVEKMVLVLSYGNANRVELKELVDVFRQRAKEMGVKLSIARFEEE